ncbi:MAG: transmembrane domain-containing protein [Propionibacteriaceae bacterium]|jgi:hypothetical protein|nr:transmembrane domain-containing protein [Propionibacteriaceae bacterium]
MSLPQAAPYGSDGPNLPKKPGIAGIVVGILLMVLVPIICVVIGITVTTMRSSALVPGGESNDVTFPITEAATIESNGSTVHFIWGSPNAPETCGVTDSSGASITVEPLGDTPATVDGVEYSATGVFQPPQAGDYLVSCMAGSEPVDEIVITSLDALATIIPIIIALAVGGLFFVAGLVLLIISILRRNRWKKDHQAALAAAYDASDPYGYANRPETFAGEPTLNRESLARRSPSSPSQDDAVSTAYDAVPTYGNSQSYGAGPAYSAGQSYDQAPDYADDQDHGAAPRYGGGPSHNDPPTGQSGPSYGSSGSSPSYGARAYPSEDEERWNGPSR